MSLIKNFEDIICWKESRILNQRMGEMIDQKRFDHNYRLINQIEGSAGSIMDNIAEGFERGGNREFIQFLAYSKGSLGEVRSQIYRLFDRKVMDKKTFEILQNDCLLLAGKIGTFMTYLRNSQFRGNKFKD